MDMDPSRFSARQAGAIGSVIALLLIAGVLLQRTASPSVQWERVWLSRASHAIPVLAPKPVRYDDPTQIIENPASDSDSRALAYMQRAERSLAAGETEAAYRDLTAALALKPLQPKTAAGIRDVHGALRIATHDYRGAIADFDASLAADPGNTLTYLCRGTAFARVGDYTSALADMDGARRGAQSQRDETYAIVKRMHFDLRTHPNIAAKMARTFNRIDAGIVATRGSIWRGQGQYAKAIADYSSALALTPDDPKLLAGREQAYFLNGDWGAAWHDLSQGAALSSHGPPPRRSTAIVCAV
jgi:tetratricopeptide (TPR) repeat protein